MSKILSLLIAAILSVLLTTSCSPASTITVTVSPTSVIPMQTTTVTKTIVSIVTVPAITVTSQQQSTTQATTLTAVNLITQDASKLASHKV